MLILLRYAARSLLRTPGVAAALVLTIAFGVGANAAVQGFVRGLLTPPLRLPDGDTLVSVVGVDADGVVPVSYADYRSIAEHRGMFAWVGAARESQEVLVADGRSLTLAVATVTRELGELFHLAPDASVVVSHRMRHGELRPASGDAGPTLLIDGAAVVASAVAPEGLEGLYAGRHVDVWRAWHDGSRSDVEKSRRDVWVIARLRPGVSLRQADDELAATLRDDGALRVIAYTGIAPEMADGLSRISTLLRAAALAVFVIACANVAGLLLSRASSRSRDTAVRVALGASRGQLARQLLAESAIVSAAGGAAGLLCALWTSDIVPLLFFTEDAAQLVFAPDLVGILAVSAACTGLTLACGLLPLAEMRADRPALVLQRESTGPSITMRRLRTILVVIQMALCTLLVIASGLLIESFRSALQTSVGRRLGTPVLATIESRMGSSRGETVASGVEFFRAVESAAASVPGVTPRAWVSVLPGVLPAWQQFRVEQAALPVREESMHAAAFTPAVFAHVTLPPVAGRMFGGQDAPDTCRVAIVNDAAARAVFGGDAVGRAIDDPVGRRVEIVGVVAPGATAGNAPPPTVYYYAAQTAPPVARAKVARFRVPVTTDAPAVVLDANIVSSGYFAAMGWTLDAGRSFADDATGCRVAVVNQVAAARYFGGQAVGAAVIDRAGRRTDIIGVVRSVPLRTLQRRVEPSIYFPMAQNFLRGMTLLADAPPSSDHGVVRLHRRLEGVPGRGPAGVVVRTLDAHLRQTALAPLRLGMTLIVGLAATALMLGVIGLYGTMTDAARRRRRETAVRIALGATGWRVIRQVVAEGARLAAAGTCAGMVGAIIAGRWLAAVTPGAAPLNPWVWAAAPLVLLAAVALASVIPAGQALRVDPIAVTRDRG